MFLCTCLIDTPKRWHQSQKWYAILAGTHEKFIACIRQGKNLVGIKLATFGTNQSPDRSLTACAGS